MKVLWTLAKVVLALALLIPASIIVFATALGIFGALVGLAFVVLRLAVLGLIGYGLFRLAMFLFGGRSPAPARPAVQELPPVDPYYEAAKRELDRDLGHSSR